MLTCHFDGAISRVPINNDDLRHIGREPLKNVRQILRLVEGGYHYADGRNGRSARVTSYPRCRAVVGVTSRSRDRAIARDPSSVKAASVMVYSV